MRRTDYVMGTCDGTAAAIYVCLGFIPEYVKLWNMEDGGSKFPFAEWFRQWSLISAHDEGLKFLVGTTYITPSYMTANGIAPYSGGDEIAYDGVDKRWEVATADVSEKYVDGHYIRVAAADALFKCVGDVLCPNPSHGQKVKTPAGFIIGTDSDLNADTEQLFWMALR